MHYLSTLLASVPSDDLQIELIEERGFERLARVTSIVDVPTCVFIAEPKYVWKIQSSVTMVITKADIAPRIDTAKRGVCICDKPNLLFFRLLNHLNRLADVRRADTVVGEGCSISPRASVADHDVTIGKNVVIEDFAVIYPNTVIGDGCTIRSGAKIGIQDYNYYSEAEGPVHLVHAGGLVLEPNVEVGYNTVIGKSLYADDVTFVGRNTKISHNCSIGHDVQLQENCMVYSGTVIGGYTVVGKGSHLTMNTTIKNGIVLGENVKVCMGSSVIVNTKSGKKVIGNPAVEWKI